MLKRLFFFLFIATLLYSSHNIIDTPHYKARKAMFEQDVENVWNNILLGDSHFEFNKWGKEHTNLGIA